MSDFEERLQNLLVFDEKEAERLKQEGMKRAASKEERQEILSEARDVAASLAVKYGMVTIDDVVDFFRDVRNINLPACLGNGMGSVLNNSGLVWRGKMVKSKRISNHSRLIMVWEE